MPGLDCEKLSCVEQKYVEDKLCQSRNVKSRKVQVKICPTKVGEAHFWCRPHLVLPNRVVICGFLISISQIRQISVLIGEKSA